MEAWVQGHHFPSRSRGGVAFLDGVDIFADSGEHAPDFTIPYYFCRLSAQTGLATGFPHRGSQPCNACQTRSAVNGICSASTLVPFDASASSTALTTAGVAPMVPNSPTP